jgi:MFS family permease
MAESMESLNTIGKVFSGSNLFEIYTLNIILSFDYYIIVFLVPIYYSELYGLSDTEAGLIFGGIGAVIGVLALLGVSTLSILGCKGSLILSALSTFLGFTVLSICRNFTLSLVLILGLICPGNALAWPVLGIEIKYYSKESNRSTSNSIMMMGNYLSGIIAGTYIDIVWTYFEDPVVIFDIVFSTAAAISGVGFLISMTIKNNQKFESSLKSRSDSVFKKSKFWKFIIVIICITILHSVCFEQLDATFPKFLVRVIGDKAHFGVLLGIHSAHMMVGALVFTPLAFKYDSYNLILIGGLLGCLASTMLILGSSYINFIAFVILLSSGESILVPRTLDYTMKVADSGDEAIYLVLCNSPYYFGMVLTGLFSGKLLRTYCPETNDEDCFLIWKTVAIGTLGIISFMTLLKFCISHKENAAETPPIID